MSAVREYFEMSAENIKMAVCSSCNLEESRRESHVKSFNTSNTITHLRIKHLHTYTEYQLKASTDASKKQRRGREQGETSGKAATPIKQAFEKVYKYGKDSAKAKSITE